MSVIAWRTLRRFIEDRSGSRDHKALEAALDAWFDEVRKARWSSMADVKGTYATASVVTSERVVFNIRGNNYRLVVAIDFEKSIVFVKWIGTHAEFDRIDVKAVRHED